MPASSKKQQHFFGMVHALQKGKLKVSSLPKSLADKLTKAADSMSQKASGEFAKSVKESVPVRLSFADYVVLGDLLIPVIEQLSQEELAQVGAAYGKLSK